MRKKSIMLLLSAMMVEFGNISYHFFSRKVLQWPWQSKSFLYTILMPFLLYLAIRCTEEGMKKTEIAMLAVVLFANGAASLMGVGYSTIMLFLVGLVMCVHKRSIGVLGKTVLSVVPTGVFLIFCVAVS